MVGVEALLRWPQAPSGLITPDIIEWAERKGLIAELDTLMLCKALEDLSTWSLARNTPFTLAVNVSATGMQQGQWAQRVIDVLDHTKLPGKRLCLEITEGVLLKSDSVVLSQLTRLRAIGVKVALDDFGTGYSSIGYLRQLPVDRIKLDRMFISGLVTDLKAKEIVRSVVRLASSLEIEVVAEGVEDAVTAETLLQLGCPLAQGWLFSKAVPGEAVGRWLAAGLPLYPDHAFDLSDEKPAPAAPPRAASSSG
jgi:EAL domain-containing protein (putative c-di-GMP-specific phosphodiesterase class I)